jgi:cytochrome c551/c552
LPNNQCFSPTVKKAPEKAVLESAALKPSSPAKTEMPLTVNKGTEGGSLNREEGLALANKSGCLVCHKIETKLIGPAWRDVSKRYNGDTGAKARLIAKVKMGGKGNWTDVTGGIAMPPYSPQVSDENIEKLVTFVLSQ